MEPKTLPYDTCSEAVKVQAAAVSEDCTEVEALKMENQEVIEVKCEPSQIVTTEVEENSQDFPVIKIDYGPVVKIENDPPGGDAVAKQCEPRSGSAAPGLNSWEEGKGKDAPVLNSQGQPFKIENCSGTYMLVQADGCVQGGQPASCDAPVAGQERVNAAMEYPYRDSSSLPPGQEAGSHPLCYSYVLVNQTPLTVLESTAAFDCNVCGLVFTDVALLNSHKATHSCSEASNSSSNEGRYPCELCGGSFETVEELQSHVVESHGPGSERTGDGSSPEVLRYEPCRECNGSGVIMLEDDTSDSVDSDRPFQCKICNKTFTRYSSLWSHKKLHSGEKPFKCEFCGTEFAKLPYLQAHTRVHTGTKPFKCTVCAMQFTQSQHLKNHERIHSGEKPFECDVCKKTFARHSTLWNHRRIHTGHRPYHCDLCGMAFSQKTHLNNHANTHQEEKLYRCNLCGLDFGYKTTLTRHLKVRHSGEKMDADSITVSPADMAT